MLENVGSRSGVGPAIVESFSSQAVPATTHTVTARAGNRGRMISLLRGWTVVQKPQGDRDRRASGVAFAHRLIVFSRALTTRTPFIDSYPLPQYAEHAIWNSADAVAVNSMVTGMPSRGISSDTLNFLMPI